MEKQKTAGRGVTRPRTTSTGEIETGMPASADRTLEATGDPAMPERNTTSAGAAPASSTGAYGTPAAGERPHGGIVNKVKERATAQLSSQKGRATDGLDTIVHAVRQTTQQLRAEDHGTVAEYIDKAAEQMERLSTRIREKDVNELLRDAQQVARRQPAVFIGGSFALGLLAARFIKSSQRNSASVEYRYESEGGLDRYNTGAY